jgi:hypothetical protein
MLSEVLDRNHLAPIGVGKCFTFQKGTRRNFLNIMCVSGGFIKRRKRTVVPGDYNVSDHRYVLHDFKGLATPRSRRHFSYWTSDIVPERFLANFDVINWLGTRASVIESQENILQSIIEETCEVSLEKVFPFRGSRTPIYWCNKEIVQLREEIFTNGSYAQRKRQRKEINVKQLWTGYRKSRKGLRLAIFRSKGLAWKKFTATLDRDAGGKQYKRITGRLSIKIDVLFLTRPTRSNDARSRNMNDGGDADDDGCRIMVEDLRDTGKKINSKKAVCVDDIPEYW